MVAKKQAKGKEKSEIAFLTSKVVQLEKTCIKEFDKYFDKYLLEQSLEIGSKTFNMDEDTYYYWVEKDGEINQLLEFAENIYGANEMRNGILLRLISLKRLVDAKIKEPHFYHEVQSDEKFEINKNEHNIFLKFIELNSNLNTESVIEALHKELKVQYIDVSLVQFKRHFISSDEAQEKIPWKGKETEIVELFFQLQRKKIISEKFSKNIYTLISYHFINNKGKDFNPRQMSVTLQKIKDTEIFEKLFSSLIESVKS